MSQNSFNRGRVVYIVDGSRTPFLKAAGKPGPFSSADLAVHTSRDLLARQNFEAHDLDEVIAGCVMPSPDETNIGRIISLRLGCGKSTTGYSVQRNCASALQALDSAAKDIALGRHDLVLAGGVDAMSQAPLLFNKRMVNWLASWYGAKNFQSRVKTISQFRPGFLAPVIALLKGLTDPVCGLSMGQTAENLAHYFDISRDDMDNYALQSHQRVVNGQKNNYFQEIMPLYDNNGKVYESDQGVREDSSLEKLGKLKPFFDKKYGMVTPGNSSQITDGAAFLILASEDAVKKYNLSPMGKIIDINWAGLDPSCMGLGPVYASTPLIQRNQLRLDDIDYWEINEAFAAQVIACKKAWMDKAYCEKYLGLSQSFGELDLNRTNIDGGAIAVGHPVGASGARIALHLLHVLKRNQSKRGIASLCIGGGQGGAILLEAA